MANNGGSWLDRIAAAGDQIYSGFLVRDFVAKGVPGAVVMLAASVSVRADPSFRGGTPESGWAWLALYGLSVAAGFAVQAVGELIGLHRANPEGEKAQDFYKRVAAFKKLQLNPATAAQRERLVVSKELAGNLAVALILGIGLLLARAFSLRLARLGGLVLLVLVVVALIWLHREARTRQKQFEEAVISAGSDNSGTPVVGA